MLSKASPCVELSIGAMWQFSTDVRKNAGNSCSWDVSVNKKMTTAQIRKDPIKVKVLDSGKVVGQGQVMGIPLVLKMGQPQKIKCDVQFNGEPAGYVVFHAKYQGAGMEEAIRRANEANGGLQAVPPKRDQEEHARKVRMLLLLERYA